MDIQLILEFKTGLENIIQSFLKILKERFLGHPVYIYYTNLPTEYRGYTPLYEDSYDSHEEGEYG